MGEGRHMDTSPRWAPRTPSGPSLVRSGSGPGLSTPGVCHSAPAGEQGVLPGAQSGDLPTIGFRTGHGRLPVSDHRGHNHLQWSRAPSRRMWSRRPRPREVSSAAGSPRFLLKAAEREGDGTDGISRVGVGSVP